MALLALIFTNTNQIIAGLDSQTSIRSTDCTVLVFLGAKLATDLAVKAFEKEMGEGHSTKVDCGLQ